MKQNLILICLVSIKCCCFSQINFGKKPPIDLSCFKNWVSVSKNGIISSDGKNVAYFVTDANVANHLFFYSTDTKVSNEILGGRNVSFTADNSYMIYIKDDSIVINNLVKKLSTTIAGVSSYKLIISNGKEFLLYKVNGVKNTLVIYNYLTGDAVQIDGVTGYNIMEDGSIIYTQIKLYSTVAYTSLQHYMPYIKSNYAIIDSIKGTMRLQNILMDKPHQKIAFLAPDISQEVIIVFTIKGKSFRIFPTKFVDENGVRFAVNKVLNFSNTDDELYVSVIKESDSVITKSNLNTSIDIWNSADIELQSSQQDQTSNKYYLGVYRLQSNFCKVLTKENDFIEATSDNEVFVNSYQGDRKEFYWNNSARPQSFLVNASNGKRKKIEVNLMSSIKASPNGNYFIGLDTDWRDFYSIDVRRMKLVNITKKVHVPLTPLFSRNSWDRPQFENYKEWVFAGWVKGENNHVLIYDEYDIWKLDLRGIDKPVNLTNGWGRKSKTALRFIDIDRDQNGVVNLRNSKILMTFNWSTKKAGFCEINPSKIENPTILSSGKYSFEVSLGDHAVSKAANKSLFLVKRNSIDMSPNYFVTNDFKVFQQISNVSPETKYNWVTSEIVSFVTLDSQSEKAVIYKPERFDNKIKYPVIISYYERKTSDAFRYHPPGSIDFGGGDLDIPWFVSNGYIVVCPDIHYKTGEVGRSAYNSIVGIRNYLSRLSYINISRIGIQGHSFGGYETNYLVSHSSLFKAAISICGTVNFLSSYGGLRSNNSVGPSNQSRFETEQSRMGNSLWDGQNAYINNSPIFFAKSVNTPLLVVANKKDANVPFVQAVEWFVGLRRLGKKTWMLQYDDETHGVIFLNDLKDFIIRQTQFFDHYLKDSAAPRWMLYGIPAKDKGIDDGLDLVRIKDKNGKWLTPGPGLVSDSTAIPAYNIPKRFEDWNKPIVNKKSQPVPTKNKTNFADKPKSADRTN